MFRKLKSGLTKGVKSKYRLDVAVSSVEGLPPGVAACRLQWARGAKVAVTKLAPASSGGHRGLLVALLGRGIHLTAQMRHSAALPASRCPLPFVSVVLLRLLATPAAARLRRLRDLGRGAEPDRHPGEAARQL